MRKGSALVVVIIFSAVFLILSAIFSKIAYNGCATVSYLIAREQAFWLAEAGLEVGKVELALNPNWYTDLPHYPEDDPYWLREAAVGKRERLGQGWFKIVREKGKDRLYAVGFKGNAVVILKRAGSWKEI